MALFAIVALKALGAAKSRLAPALDAAERIALVEEMATHVLRVVRSRVDAVLLVGPAMLRTFPDLPRLDPGGVDLNEDLARAAERIDRQPGDILLVLPADLPHLAADDVDALAAVGAAGIGIAPDRAGTGTNGLAFAGGSGFRFAFGSGSRRAHEAEARHLGLPAILVDRPGLAFDVDVPEDLGRIERRIR